MSSYSPSSTNPSLSKPKSREDANGGAGPRRSSLGFLKRSKSQEPFRKTSGGKRMTREQQREEEIRRHREAIPQQPPTLPVLAQQPQLKTFGGEGHRPDSVAIISGQTGPRNFSKNSADRASGRNIPMPPIPASSPAPGTEDPYARTESMTHRGRYSYASSAISTINSPRRVRRRKDPTPYNILVIGAKNSGKTSFLNFLRQSLALPPKKRPTRGPDEFEAPPASVKAIRNFVHHYLETEIDGERVGLTLWDSQGLEKNVVDLQLREMSSFLESKFEDSFGEEMKVVRAPGVRDTHIHCVFLILDPIRLDANITAAQQSVSNGVSSGKFNLSNRIIGGLDEDFDLQVLRTLQGKTTVVPVISKADTITTAHMAFLKRTVWDSLKKASLDPLEALNFQEESEEEDEEGNGITDSFDERDEDEEAERNAYEEDGNVTPHTDDSDTVPPQQPTPGRRESKRRSVSSMTMTANLESGETPVLPMSILSPDSYSLNGSDGPVGRKFPWGFADPYNPEHCDFTKLKESVFVDWRADLREASREIWYESWRTGRLNHQGGPPRGMTANGGRKMGGSKSARAP